MKNYMVLKRVKLEDLKTLNIFFIIVLSLFLIPIILSNFFSIQIDLPFFIAVFLIANLFGIIYSVLGSVLTITDLGIQFIFLKIPYSNIRGYFIEGKKLTLIYKEPISLFSVSKVFRQDFFFSENSQDISSILSQYIPVYLKENLVVVKKNLEEKEKNYLYKGLAITLSCSVFLFILYSFLKIEIIYYLVFVLSLFVIVLCFGDLFRRALK